MAARIVITAETFNFQSVGARAGKLSRNEGAILWKLHVRRLRESKGYQKGYPRMETPSLDLYFLAGETLWIANGKM